MGVLFVTPKTERKKQRERRQLSNEINTLSKVVVAKYQELYAHRQSSMPTVNSLPKIKQLEENKPEIICDPLLLSGTNY